MVTRTRPFLFIGLILAALVWSACSDDDESSATESEPPAESSDPDEGALDAYDFSAVSPIVADFVEENGLNGAGLIVVDRDDGVVYHDHWGEFDEDRVSLIASASKMISAGVLLHLDDAGLLDVDAPVSEVVEWGTAHPDITTAQLISNSSGLPGLGASLPAYQCERSYTVTMQQCAEAVFTTTDDDADVIPPDTEFRYAGVQWQVAGAVAEVASGKSWAELIDEIYVEPCDVESLGFNSHFEQLGSDLLSYPTGFDGPSSLAPTDNPHLGGGGYITTGDYGQLLLMNLRDGKCGDTQVLSPEALDAMHADRIAQVYDGSASSPDVGYGMGWWVDREGGLLTDPGAHGAIAWLDLEDGYGAYLVLEEGMATGLALAEQLYDVVDAASNAA